MVCLDNGISCVPKNSRSDTSIRCLPVEYRCNGIDECEGGSDEEQCNEALLTGGVQALIAITVIAVLILIPVIYVIIQKRRAAPLVPECMRTCMQRVSATFKRETEADRSSTALTSTSTGNSSDKDGFTNVGFDSARTDKLHYEYNNKSRTNMLKSKSPENDERVPSYREWQMSRLQAPTNETARTHGQYLNNSQTNLSTMSDYQPRPTYESRIQPQGQIDHGPIRYAPPAARVNQESADSRRPYAISSQDGRAKYEARTHLESESRFPNEPRRAATTMDNSSYNPARLPATGNGYNQERHHYYGYSHQQQENSGISPGQLRNALKQVATSPYYNDSPGPASNGDTVV